MGSYDGLAAFLAARLDERERVATLAARKGADWKQDDPACFPGAISSTSGPVVYDEGAPDEDQAAHIVLNDPASVLRDVATKRSILARHCPVGAFKTGPEHCTHCGEETYAGRPWPCGDVRDIASSWSDHPDYRQEWAPDGRS